MRTLSDSLSLFDLSIYFTFLLFIIFSFQHFLLLFTFLEVSRQQPCALPLRSRVPRTTSSLTQVMSPKTTSSQRLVSSSIRSPRASSSSLKDVDYDDTVIGQTLHNAYRRRVDHSEGEGLSSGLSSSMSHDRTEQLDVDRDKVTSQVTKFRDKTLKANRLGLSWTDKGSRFSLTVRCRLENTNSRLIMTEEEHKN